VHFVGFLLNLISTNLTKISKKSIFNISPCIFQFNNLQTPTHAPHIQQYIKSRMLTSMLKYIKIYKSTSDMFRS